MVKNGSLPCHNIRNHIAICQIFATCFAPLKNYSIQRLLHFFVD